MDKAQSIRVFLALLIGLMLIWAGIKGNPGSLLAAFIDPANLTTGSSNNAGGSQG